MRDSDFVGVPLNFFLHISVCCAKIIEKSKGDKSREKKVIQVSRDLRGL